MTTNDQELLRRFVERRDEAAFSSLVQRHLGLVLGSACRQLGGDRHAAEDLAQHVFTQLACKAPTLLQHPCLEGWLHRATRLACLEQLRLRARRQRREQEAAMTLLQPQEQPRWEQIAPVLDEAMGELAERERNLILLRHVRGQSGAQIASRLGLSEPAARKQLERAMARLRGLLARRGIAVGAIALAALLESQAQAHVAAGLASQIATQSLSQAGALSAGVGTGWLTALKWSVLAGLMVTLLSFVGFHRTPAPATASEAVSTPAQPPMAPPETKAAQTPARETAASLANVWDFSLRLVDKESGQPVTDGSVLFWVGPDDKTAYPLGRQSLTNGIATVGWTNDCYRFLADVTCEGYADTRIEWVREQQILPVPTFYQLRLERAQPIGGLVVDQQGAPLSSAMVRAWSRSYGFFLPVPNTHQPEISFPLRQMRAETPTDAQGRWSLRRIAREVQNADLVVEISHPDFVTERSDLRAQNPLPALQAGEFRSVLAPQPGTIVSGVVLDSRGHPLAGADVTDGDLFSNPATSIAGDQHFKTDTQGAFSFTVRKTPYQPGPITAKAAGFAAQSLQWTGQPLAFSLVPGQSLRLRVVSPTGEPIPGIRVESTQFQHLGGTETNQSTRYKLAAQTDALGQVAWDDVPNEPLLINFWSDSDNYQCRVGEVLRPSPEEQVVELDPAVRVVGTVEDASTHKPIAAFRLVQQDGFDTNRIPELQPFGLTAPVSGRLFEAGHFELLLKPQGVPIAPSLRGPRQQQRLGSYLKITAPGYAAFTSGFIDASQREVRLRIPLHAAALNPIQVLGPDGAPQPEAQVLLCAASSPWEPERIFQTDGEYVLKTTASGWVSLPPDDSIQWVVAFDSAHSLVGWAASDSLKAGSTLQLSKVDTSQPGSR